MECIMKVLVPMPILEVTILTKDEREKDENLAKAVWLVDKIIDLAEVGYRALPCEDYHPTQNLVEKEGENAVSIQLIFKSCKDAIEFEINLKDYL